VSKQGGRSSMLAALDRFKLGSGSDTAKVQALLDEVKAREDQGYSYEAAEASFELLARRMLDEVPRFFAVDSFRVIVERPADGNGRAATRSQAMVSVSIAGEAQPIVSLGEGNGPVNALDTALRRDLGRYQRHIENVQLVDYKVRILTQVGAHGTEAVTRVLVESHDTGTGARWTTVGVSPNIIDASFEALLDSINYKLLQDGAVAG
jgi:2-isopropylmalate synthase